MSVAPFTRRIPKKFTKTITFTGAADLGAVGTVAVATVTGMVLITAGAIRCTTNLTSSGGTLSLGATGNTDGIVESTTASDIDAGDIWQDATPEVRISPAIINLAVNGSLFLTVGSADVTAGVLEIDFYWLPLSDDGNMA